MGSLDYLFALNDEIFTETGLDQTFSFAIISVPILLIGIVLGMVLSQCLKHKKSHRKKQKLPTNSKEDQKLLDTKPKNVPKHIAVIMDGNRRFGRKTHSDPLQGHWAGGQTLVDFVQWCMADGVKIVTAYAFSTENWSRDPFEVQTLMTIFAKYAETFKTEALAKNVKVNVLISDSANLPPQVSKSVQDLRESTAHCDGFTLNLCLSYGSRSEIVEACKQIGKKLIDGDLKLQQVNESSMSNYLLTKGLPDPDILIRTSGEYRISNFLLWQLAYTELFFVDKFWPQFTHLDLRRILHEYNDRNRRFGK